MPAVRAKRRAVLSTVAERIVKESVEPLFALELALGVVESIALDFLRADKPVVNLGHMLGPNITSMRSRSPGNS